MSCCSRYCAAEEQFSTKVAEGDLRLYRRRGPETTTRILLREIRRWPLRGMRLLDVGGGVGVIGAELAGEGLAGLTFVDASPAYLEVARKELEARYAPSAVQFLLGDFALLANTLPDADIVTMDRVVCCYQDGQKLLQVAAARTRRVLAFSYPRDRWYVRTVVAVENFVRRIRGKDFRAFVHLQGQLCGTVQSAGLALAARRETFIWSIDVYRREEAA